MNRLSILHAVWRVCTILLVIGLALLTTFILFPYLDHRMPVFPAALIVYGVIAYIFLPVVGRFWHLVIKPNHIPRYVVTPDGWPADPINIAVVAKSKRHFIRTMRLAGWYTADPPTLKNLLKEGYAMIFDRQYLTAPFSTFYLFGRKQDIGFQIPFGDNKSPRHRHHVRFWQLKDMSTTTNDDTHFLYWLERMRHLFGRKRTIWIGAAIEDTGIHGIRWRNLQLTHATHAEHTKERDYIIDTLDSNGLIKSIEEIKDGEPFTMRSQNLGTSFVVDGYLKVIALKNPFIKRLKKH